MKTHDFCGSFGLRLMSGGQLSCIDCGSKFGPAVWGSVCEVCGLLQQVKTHLISPRYPAAEKEVAVRYVRECLHKVLEHSDTFWGAQLERQGPIPAKKEKEAKSPELIPVKEEKDEKDEKEEKVDKSPLEEPAKAVGEGKVSLSSPSTPPPGLTGKSAPARPPFESKARESEGTPRKKEKRSSATPDKEKRSEKEKKKRRRRRSKSRRTRSGSRDRKRRKVSREAFLSPVAEGEGRGDREEKKKAKPSSVPSTSSRGGQAPRSPSRGPIDRRGYYQEPFWKGPIPAGRGQRRPSPRGANKGLKKKRQQEKARAFGWKFSDGRRWR